ncbi:zincin [Agrocybe pediades]|nr:zincin [Agrocybe pediades]
MILAVPLLVTTVVLQCSSLVMSAAIYQGTHACGTQVSDDQLLEKEQHFNSHRVYASKFNSILQSQSPFDVYFHVIYKNETLAGGLLSEADIISQLVVLNQTFAPTGMSFILKEVTLTLNEDWFSRAGPFSTSNLQDEMKSSLRKGGVADLNIYSLGFETGDVEGLLGYSTFPRDYEQRPSDDGVVVLYSSLPGGSTSYYNEGKTTTHEVGHWVGLYHTFQGGCFGSGDQVSDTAPEASPAYGCPVNRHSCIGGGPDPLANYMDYGYDSCMTNFTPGQIERLVDQHHSNINPLYITWPNTNTIEPNRRGESGKAEFKFHRKGNASQPSG